MARGNKTGDPVDWVTRAADDAIRHARENGGEDRVVTCASGASPSGPVHLGNLREFLTVHFVADELRRRGVEVRHLHGWDDYDRFRKVPAGVDPSWAEHIGRPLSAVPDPWECHDSWAEHFKAPLRDALRRAGRGDGGDLPDRAVPGRRLPRAGAPRACATATPSRRCWPAPHQEGRAGRRERPGGRGARRLGGRRRRRGDRRRRLAGPLPLQALLPRVRPRHRHGHVLRRRDHRPRPTPATPAASPASPTWRPRTRASWSGRSTGRCAGPSRASTSSPAALDHATPGSSYTVGKELVKRIFGRRAPSFVALRLRRLRRHAEDVVVHGRRADRGRRAADPGGADPALALRAPRSPSRPSTSTSAPRWCGSTTSGTRWPARPPTPQRRDAQVLAYERAVATTTAGTLPAPPRRSCRSGCSPRSPT